MRRYDLLINAFKIVQETHSHARLVLVGVGPLESELRSYARKLFIEDRVVFIIEQPGYRYYNLFDCFALTSDKEGPSIALLEAMSFGLPCIRTNEELTHPVIKNETNGLLTPAGSARSLAQAFIRVLENPALGYQLGKEAKKTVANFDIQNTVQQYEIIFKSVSKTRSTSHEASYY